MEDIVSIVNTLFADYFGKTLSMHGEEYIIMLAEKYGWEEVAIAAEISCDRYGHDAIEAVFRIGGILYNRNKFKHMIEDGD